MNRHGPACSDQRLRNLLQSDDESGEMQRYASHVDQCPRCQARLEQLAAEPAEWRFVKDSLSSAEADHVLTDDAIDQRPGLDHTGIIIRRPGRSRCRDSCCRRRRIRKCWGASVAMKSNG